MSDKARLAAYGAFKRISNGAYSNLLEFKDALSPLDRAFAEKIVIGTLERKITLEYIINEVVKRPTKPEIIQLIMTGAYQILYLDRVPDSAACDETVTIANEIFGMSTAGFVNAVLRGIARSKQILSDKIDKAEEYIKYSVDKDLFELIKSQYPNDYGKIFDAFLERSDAFVRVNTLKTNSEAVASEIGGIKINDKTVKIEDLRAAISGLEKGDYYIQGLASQKAVELLDAKPKQRVIDVCACPGGKTLGAAIDMENMGEIFAFDLHSKKLPIIERSAKKLGISIINTDTHDAKTAIPELIGTADRVICDVPCSGTGVMGAKPEIKYKSPESFEGLYPTQKAILNSASQYLKIGGEMVYSTCSINRHENGEIVKEFIDNNKDFSLISERTVLPFEAEREGFYMAKIRRDN